VFEYRHHRLVLSVPVLRPEADSPERNGLLQRGFAKEPPLSTLRYQVIRVWQLPVEELLAGGVGMLALAPIANVSEGDVRRVIRRLKERLTGPRAPRRAADVWAATYVLLSLRYSDEIAHALFEEVMGMEESATYQAIRRRERAEEGRRFLLLQGETKFGPPEAPTRAAIDEISDPAQLEALGVRLMTAGSWQELLRSRRRRNGRRRSGR
jgi:hypothetical protein